MKTPYKTPVHPPIKQKNTPIIKKNAKKLAHSKKNA